MTDAGQGCAIDPGRPIVIAADDLGDGDVVHRAHFGEKETDGVLVPGLWVGVATGALVVALRVAPTGVRRRGDERLAGRRRVAVAPDVAVEERPQPAQRRRSG